MFLVESQKCLFYEVTVFDQDFREKLMLLISSRSEKEVAFPYKHFGKCKIELLYSTSVRCFWEVKSTYFMKLRCLIKILGKNKCFWSVTGSKRSSLSQKHVWNIDQTQIIALILTNMVFKWVKWWKTHLKYFGFWV